MDHETSLRNYDDWIGRDAYDRDGDKIGEIDNIFVDTETRRPEWVAVKTGWFGMNSSFAPIVGSAPFQDGIRLDVDKDTVKDAPNVGSGAGLDADEEQRLYEHYRIDREAGMAGYIAPERSQYGYEPGRRADEGYPVDEAAMTLREEELDVSTRREQVGTVRLRKYVTTEQETVTVPVEKERVVLEREPASGRATGDLGEEEVEVPLYEEHAEVDKHAVDRERVRVGKERIEDTEKVQADLRKERVETEGDADLR